MTAEMTEETETPEVTPDEVVEEVAEATEAATPEVAAPAPAVDAAEAADDESRTARKVREGTVVSNKMDKTAVVAVVTRVPHAKYNKMILQTTKLYAHDETNDVNIGDKVRVMETRALSKKNRWRVTDVLERAK